MSEEEVEVQLEDQIEPKEGTPLWSKLMVVVAVLFLVAGFAMKASAKQVPQGETGAVATEGMLSTQGLVAGGQGTGGTDGSTRAADDSLSSYSPFFIKGGFSFLMAFCVGMAVRMFFKVTALFIGVVALALFVLNKAGWVDVDWNTMSEQWDRFSGTIADQADEFKSFITGSLPAAGMGSLGLFAGFKRG